VKISHLIKTIGLWLSGILFLSEILGEVLLIFSYFIRMIREYLSSDFIFNSYIAGNLLSELLILIHLIVGLIFLSQLFNKDTTLDLKSYRWVYSLSVLIFLAFLVRYISNSYTIEQIISFNLNTIIIFISLTFMFFFQKAYDGIHYGKYSYMIFLLISIGYYLFYLINIAPPWEYHRIIFW
jgi:hypothetical protein